LVDEAITVSDEEHVRLMARASPEAPR
jgi:hypothetical protein